MDTGGQANFAYSDAWVEYLSFSDAFEKLTYTVENII